jgi:caffeoyl-CoA O-methyltransferase
VVTYRDRMLPTQAFNSMYYRGDDILGDISSVLTTFSPSHCVALHEHERVPFQELSTPPEQLMLIKFLIDVIGAKTFLEIGTYVGHTAMMASKFMGNHSEVVTIEKFDEFSDLAQKSFCANELPGKISLLRGDAIEMMQGLPDLYFDIIYIDGGKENYLPMLKMAEEKLSAKGVIIIDDIFFQGDALNVIAETDKGHGCKAVLEHCKWDARFSTCVLPVGDGVLMLKRMTHD